MEAIIALQRALQDGIPESEEDDAEEENGLGWLAGMIGDAKNFVLQQQPLTLLLTKIGELALAALRPLRRSRLRKSTAGQR